MSAVRNRLELEVVRGPELTKEQLRQKAPAALRRHLRKAQLKLVPPPRVLAPAGFRFIALSVLLVLLACPAFAADTLAINLAPAASVGGRLFRIGDIASYASGDAQLWAAIAQEPAGYSPLPGATAYLAGANVLGLLKQRGYAWQDITVIGSGVSITAAPPQSITGGVVLELLRASLSERLGTSVEIIEQQALPVQDLRGGTVSLNVRYPDKPGQWLPVSVDYYVNGRLQDTLPLAQYVSFKLAVAAASAPVPSRTKLGAADITLASVELRPGNEVVVDAAAVAGLETRTALAQGALIKLSQLKRPFTVERGEAVTLLIGGAGVELRAVATALNNAYAGQNVLVQRDGDGLRFTGELQEDKVVVVR
jgi:flagella basal body P-ring formation protein FlgA